MKNYHNHLLKNFASIKIQLNKFAHIKTKWGFNYPAFTSQFKFSSDKHFPKHPSITLFLLSIKHCESFVKSRQHSIEHKAESVKGASIN